MPRDRVQHEDLALLNGRGGSLYGQVWRPPCKPTAGIAIVHGLGDHSSRFDHVAHRFTTEGYLVVAHDQVGHGKTPGRRGHVGSYDWLLDDIGCLIATLRDEINELPVFLFGQSLGGSLVLNYVLRRSPNIAGVVASSPLIFPAMPVPSWKTTLGKWLRFAWPSFTLANGLKSSGLSHDPEAVAAYQADPLVHSRVSAELGVEMLAAGRWSLEHASELALPTLVMHGTGDKITSFEGSSQFAASAGKTCTLRSWPGLFHELHWEYEKQEVLSFVCQWMQGVLDDR